MSDTAPGWPLASSGRQYPHLDDLRNWALQDVSKFTEYSSVDSLLDNADQCNHQVSTNVEFKRPDRAYLEWIKSEELLKLINRHRDFPYLPQNKKEKFLACRKHHEAQRPMQSKLQEVIEDNNAKVGTRRAQSSSATPDSLSGASTTARPFSVPRAPDIQGTHSSRPVSQPVESRSSTQSDRDYSQVVPDRNGSRNSYDPLVARFSQLRTSGTPSGRLPYPTDRNQLDHLVASGPTRSEDSLRLSHSASAPDSRETRPSGPRQMPGKPSAPPHPPKRPLQPTVTTSLPRAPSPVYSPARNIPAPASIEPPRNTARSTGPALQRVNQVETNGYQLPPQNYTTRVTSNSSSTRSQAMQKLPFSERTRMLSPSDVLKFHREGYRVLMIDARPRPEFDQDHIGLTGGSAAVICIDPYDVGYGRSFGQLLDGLVYTPAHESDSLKNVDSFDLVIMYDENTASDSFLRSPANKSTAPALRNLFDTLTEFNYEKQKCNPIVLAGGIDAWVDVFGPQSLVSSTTSGIPRSPRVPPKEKASARPSNTNQNIGRPSMRPRRGTVQLAPAVAEQWREQSQREQVAPVEMNDLEAEDRDEPRYAHNYDEFFDFFSRFPPAEQQSMVVPRPRPQRPEPAPVPAIPSRPAPAVSRPSYSGVSDRQASQSSAARPSSHPPPLYTTRFIAQALKLPHTGLVNFGNTCYMNATLQCLLGTLPLTRFFLDDTWRGYVQRDNKAGSRGVMPEIYAALIRGLWKDSDHAIRPITFRKFFMAISKQFADDHQHDAHEFLIILLDCLHEDLNTRFSAGKLRPLTKDQLTVRNKIPVSKVSRIEWERTQHQSYSFVDTLFRGQVVTQIYCKGCRHTTSTYETFTQIEVPTPDAVSRCTIYDCLNLQYVKEDLDDYKCDGCSETGTSRKRVTITRIPQILVVQFVRGDAFGSRKVKTPIEFPLHGLDMAPWMNESTCSAPRDNEAVDYATAPPFVFECYAVLRHIGDTLHSGHYMAAVRDTARGGVWRLFDDTTVTDFDPQRAARNKGLEFPDAYVVFYERSKAR